MHTTEMFDLLVRDVKNALEDLEHAKASLTTALESFTDAKVRELDPIDVVPHEHSLNVAREYIGRVQSNLATASSTEQKLRRTYDSIHQAAAHPFVRENGGRRGGFGGGY